MEPTSFTHKLFLFFEHPLFWGPIGVVGGLVGLFFYTPILFVSGLCILLAFLRAGVVSGLDRKKQVAAYIIVALVAASGLYGLQVLIKKHAPDLGKDIAKAVVNRLRNDHAQETKPESLSQQHEEPKTESSKTEPPKKVLQPIKNPLEIVAFRSDYGISIANDGPRPVHVISLLVKGHGETKSFALGLDIGSGKISEQRIFEEGILHVRTLMKLADNWEDHYKKARELYSACGMQWNFFSPSDVSLQQIKDNYTAQNLTLGYKDISGILYYRVQGLNKTEEQVVPVVETIVVNDDACPKTLMLRPAPSP